MILEIRRYEKNYLLYGLNEDFKENTRYVQKALEVMATIVPDVKNLKIASQLETFRKDLIVYRA
jgi:two-component system NtrC family sensor kinase